MPRKGVYYHGTCADHLESIMNEGLKAIPCVDRLWNDSYPNQIYLWDASKTAYDARDYAIQSAETALVFARDPRIIVVKVEAPPDMFFEDGSGNGMAEMGAVCADECIPLKYITQIEVSENLSCLVGHAIKHYLGIKNGKHWRLTDLQQEIARRIEEPIFIGDLNIQFTNHYVKDIRKKSSRQRM